MIRTFVSGMPTGIEWYENANRVQFEMPNSKFSIAVVRTSDGLVIKAIDGLDVGWSNVDIPMTLTSRGEIYIKFHDKLGESYKG